MKRQSFYMNGFINLPYTDVDDELEDVYPLDVIIVEESYRIGIETAFNVDGVLMLSTDNQDPIDLRDTRNEWQLWDMAQGSSDKAVAYFVHGLPIYLFIDKTADIAIALKINNRAIRKNGEPAKMHAEMEEIANTAFATSGSMNINMERKMVVL